jgi:hypothetical protein
MADRVSLSSDTPGFTEVGEFYSDTNRAIRYYYDAPGIDARDAKFVGYSLQDLTNERDGHLSTLDQSCAFAVLAALEARFKRDFHLRCQKKWRRNFFSVKCFSILN